MTLRKQTDGQWLVDIQPGGRSGPRIRKLFPTRGEATRYETWAKAQVQQDEWKKPRQPKFSELVAHWATTAGHLADFDARKRLLDVMASEIDYPNAITWAVYIGKRDHLTQATKNRHLAYCRAVLNRAQKDGLIKEHPLINTRPTREAERALRVLSKDEITALLSSSKPLVTVIKVCLATGARWSEANDLTAQQIQAGEVRFEVTKGKKSRSVPISEEIRGELLMLAKNGQTRLFKPLYDAFEQLIKDKEIVLPQGQMTHVLRHTFAEHFLTHGGTLRDLQEILGHTDIKTTMRYSHFQREHIKNVIHMNPLSVTTK